jgi:hypothetical protein
MLSGDSKLYRVDAEGQRAEPLCQRVPPSELQLDEKRFRDLLRAHPELLQQALAAGGMWDGEEWYYAGSEVRVSGIGQMDLLFIDDCGRPIVVETKLFRNPEARRQVVTQVSEYAFCMAEGGAIPLLRGRDVAPEIDDLMQDIDDHLRRGVLTLVIAGDAIDDRAIRLAEALLGSSRPEQTSLAFVEIAFFTAPPGDPSGWIIVPQLRRGLIARTREVFEFRVKDGEREIPGNIHVVPPTLPRRDSITEDGLLDAIARVQGTAGREAAERLLAFVRTIGAEVAFRQTGASVRLADPQGSGVRVTLFVISSRGTFYVWWLNRWERIGADPMVADQYLRRLESLLGASPAHRPTDDRNAVPLGVVAQRLDDVVALIQDTVQTLRGVV